jgi:hypothetical protein
VSKNNRGGVCKNTPTSVISGRREYLECFNQIYCFFDCKQTVIKDLGVDTGQYAPLEKKLHFMFTCVHICSIRITTVATHGHSTS